MILANLVALTAFLAFDLDTRQLLVFMRPAHRRYGDDSNA
jgi:hypothetical protein